MREDFILDDRGVVPHIDMFNRYAWDFRDHDSSKSIGDGGVNADQVKVNRPVREALYLNFEILCFRR